MVEYTTPALETVVANLLLQTYCIILGMLSHMRFARDKGTIKLKLAF